MEENIERVVPSPSESQTEKASYGARLFERFKPAKDKALAALGATAITFALSCGGGEEQNPTPTVSGGLSEIPIATATATTENTPVATVTPEHTQEPSPTPEATPTEIPLTHEEQAQKLIEEEMNPVFHGKELKYDREEVIDNGNSNRKFYRLDLGDMGFLTVTILESKKGIVYDEDGKLINITVQIQDENVTDSAMNPENVVEIFRRYGEVRDGLEWNNEEISGYSALKAEWDDDNGSREQRVILKKPGDTRAFLNITRLYN